MRRSFKFLIFFLLIIVACDRESLKYNEQTPIILNKELQAVLDSYIKEKNIKSASEQAIILNIFSDRKDTIVVMVSVAKQFSDFMTVHHVLVQNEILIGIEYVNIYGIVDGLVLYSELMKYGFPKDYERFINRNGEITITHDDSPFKKENRLLTFARAQMRYKLISDSVLVSYNIAPH